MIVRASAAMALKKLGTSTGPVVTSLARVLRDEYCLVRHNAAEALGETEPADKTVTNAIVEATRDDSLFVRDAAQATLRKIEMRSLRQR
jgi:HEAT repeat protein